MNTNFETPLYRRNTLGAAMTGDVRFMSDNDLNEIANILRDEADRLISSMKASNYY